MVGVCAAQTSVTADVRHHLADGVDAQRLVLEPHSIAELWTVAVLLKQPGALRVEFAEVQLDCVHQTVVSKLAVVDAVVTCVLVAG